MDSPPPNPAALFGQHPDSSTSDLSSNTTSEDSVLKRLNCPLCTNTFGYSFGLECHLLSVHQEALQAIRDGQRHLSCCGCLCCAAQFVKVETLVKHLLEDHRDFLLNSLSPMIGFQTDFASDFEDSAPMTASLRRHFDCQFCGQKFLRRHKKLFMVHLEQKHVKDLELAIRDCNLALFNISQHVENLEVKLLQNLSSKVRITASNPDPQVEEPGISSLINKSKHQATKDRSKKRRSLSAQRVKSDRLLDSDDFQFIDAYEKLEISPPHHYEIIASPPILTSTMKRLKKKLKRSESSIQASSVKWPQNNRRNSGHNNKDSVAVNLSHRFKLSTSSYKSVPQPEPAGNSEEDEDKRTSSSTFSTNSMNEDVHQIVHFSGNLFKCNLCEIAFAENAFLLTHLKNRHRSTVSKALKPHFSCGACPAKFFKNSFLVKHCECHEKTR